MLLPLTAAVLAVGTWLIEQDGSLVVMILIELVLFASLKQSSLGDGDYCDDVSFHAWPVNFPLNLSSLYFQDSRLYI